MIRVSCNGLRDAPDVPQQPRIVTSLQVMLGVGFAMTVVLMVQAMADLAVMTWAAQAMYLLFQGQHTTMGEDVDDENFFYRRVLDVGEATDLSSLGDLHGQLTICLGIVCAIVFLLVSASSKSIGKVWPTLIRPFMSKWLH